MSRLCFVMSITHKHAYNGLMKQLTPGNNEIFNLFYISIYNIYFNMCAFKYLLIFHTKKMQTGVNYVVREVNEPSKGFYCDEYLKKKNGNSESLSWETNQNFI